MKWREKVYERTKEYLKQYQRAKRRLLMAKESLAEVESLVESISIDYENLKVQSEHNADQVSELVIRLTTVRAQCIAAADEAVTAMEKVSCIIGRVEQQVLRRILEKRYICGDAWEQIAVDMHYSYRWLLKLHGQALIAVSQLLP